MAFEWLIESCDDGGAVVRVVHSGLLGENWEAEYNGLSVGDHAYMTKLAGPRSARHPSWQAEPAGRANYH
jgi:hypothetical protein